MFFFILVIIVVGIVASTNESRGESFGCFKWILAILFCFAFPPVVPFVLFFAAIGFFLSLRN